MVRISESPSLSSIAPRRKAQRGLRFALVDEGFATGSLRRSRRRRKMDYAQQKQRIGELVKEILAQDEFLNYGGRPVGNMSPHWEQDSAKRRMGQERTRKLYELLEELYVLEDHRPHAQRFEIIRVLRERSDYRFFIFCGEELEKNATGAPSRAGCFLYTCAPENDKPDLPACYAMLMA